MDICGSIKQCSLPEAGHACGSPNTPQELAHVRLQQRIRDYPETLWGGGVGGSEQEPCPLSEAAT
eukprot:361549-Chlamydomonas_euryale.AAC.2